MASSDVVQDFDAVVIGAGFGGLRALVELEKMGLSARSLEAAPEVGGTWYWNCYPGARTDSEAWAYCYSFSEEIWNEWDWPDRLPSQSMVLEYLKFVADRLNLRQYIEFNTRVASAIYNEDDQTWLVTTEAGDRYRCRYLISASGILSKAYKPPFPGLETFKGDWYVSGQWPQSNVDFKNKKIAIVGSGSTGVQLLPMAAAVADQVTMFQRTPNFVLPTRNYPMEDEERDGLKARYEEIWSNINSHVFAFPMTPAGRLYSETPVEEREPIFDRCWETGGFRFVFESFDDLLVDEEANFAAAEYIRRKIRTIVKDPETAEILCPKYPLFAKRPPLGSFYYETYNRDNVALVDLSQQAIDGITEKGIRVGETEHEFDILIFAIGFDAGTGAMTSMDIRGKNGIRIQDKWKDGPKTHLGIAIDEFPNLFMITGPQSPFSNIPPVIEQSVSWINKIITTAKSNGKESIETTPEAVEAWGGLLAAYIDATMLSRGSEVGSWFTGANIPGKSVAPLFHFGGAGTYFQQLEESASGGFSGFEFT